jgi:hypothetical protein
MNLDVFIERTADDIAVMEFLSLSALMNNVGTLANSVSELQQVASEQARQIAERHKQCYGRLLRRKAVNPTEYFINPIYCTLDSFDLCLHGLNSISAILCKTTAQLCEPYSRRLDWYTHIDQK